MTKSSRLICDKADRINSRNKSQYFEKTKVLWMPVSIGQDYHELDGLLESIKLIRKNLIHITLIKVIIVDLAQRYHLAIKNNTSPEKMLYESKKRGLSWRESYEHLIRNCFKNITVEFNTWDEWLNHENYNQSRQQIDILYNEKTNFKKHLENDVLEFERRYFNRESRYLTTIEKEYCRECIKEECATLILWSRSFVSLGHAYIFYPKKIPEAMSFIKQNFTNFLYIFAQFSKSKRNPYLFFKSDKTNLIKQEASAFTIKHRRFSI